jgi:hypothetical protein
MDAPPDENPPHCHPYGAANGGIGFSLWLQPSRSGSAGQRIAFQPWGQGQHTKFSLWLGASRSDGAWQKQKQKLTTTNGSIRLVVIGVSRSNGVGSYCFLFFYF